MERSGRLNQDVSWSHTETQALLAVWSEDGAQHSASVTNAPEPFSASSTCSMENLQEPAFYPIKLEDPAAPCALTSLASPSAQTSVMWSPSPGRRKARPTCAWSKKEVLALLALWANPTVQQELRRNVRNNAVYNGLSAKLATLGFDKTAQKCKEKLKKLKQDYKRIKNSDHLDGGKNLWFNVIDQVLSSQPAEPAEPLAEPPQPVGQDVTTETPSFATSLFESCTVRSPSPRSAENSTEPDLYIVQLEDVDTPATSSAGQTSAVCSPRHEGKKRYVHTCSWSKKEVHVLLAFWANPAVQEELRRNVRNNTVYTSLSTKLASFGFSKSPQKCKEKIKKLKQDYRRIRRSRNASWRRTAWFGILDQVLGLQPAASKRSEAPKLFSAEAAPSALDLESSVSTDVAEWLPDEVQALVALWAQPSIQERLVASGAHGGAFTCLSNELALAGFSRTPQQCRLKVKKLKEKYERMKRAEPRGNGQSDWFAVMDGVLGAGGETSEGVNSAPTAPEPEGSSGTVWTAEEVGVLLSLRAEDGVQLRLESRQEDERVFARLSSELAAQGFHKTPDQCRSKARLLEQQRGRLQEGKAPKDGWFALVDQSHGCPEPKAEAERPAEATASAEGRRLSVPSLRLLVPTLRLMCAFAWQVVRSCNVARYNKVEELVVLATELAQELLPARERAQLLLRLRARLVLEVCRGESRGALLDVQPHLRAIQDLRMSSCAQEELEELEKSKSNFVEVVHTLLDDPEERKRFFTEVFPVHYGQPYEATLQALVWKFISRLDNLLPVPDLKQTAAWLSSAPSVMEECGQLVLEWEELKALLYFHDQQTGNTNKCLSQAQNMFLPVLSLHPKTNSKQQDVAENKGGFHCGSDKEPFKKSISVEDSGNGNDVRDNQGEGKTFESSSLKPFQLQCCSMCSYSDSRASALLQHVRQEHLVQESGPFLAAEGDFLLNDEVSFGGTKECEFSSDTLKGVATPVNNGPPFECDRCEKTYLSRSSLIVHHRIHAGERRFRCHVCGKTSTQHLTRHMRMHRGENDLCAECGKAFLSSGELKLHLRSHSGERPYTCGRCGKGFVTKCLLTVHTRRHTGESPYTCPLCPKSFPSLRAQRKHLQIHTDRKSYQCLKCGKIFRQEGTFKLHVKTHDLI